MQEKTIQEVMTPHPHTVKGRTILTSVVKLFEKHGFHHVLVVDDDGHLTGVISSTDVDRTKSGASLFQNPNKEAYDDALLSTMMASDIMTSDVQVLQASDAITKAYLLFKENRFHAIPVIRDEGLVGIVTPLDLLDHFFA